MASRARYLEKLSTEKYIELTHLRNAIEGIPSVLRRKYRIDEIPVFGKLRSRQFFLFKIGAYNFGKLFRHKHRLRVESAQNLIIACHVQKFKVLADALFRTWLLTPEPKFEYHKEMEPKYFETGTNNKT